MLEIWEFYCIFVEKLRNVAHCAISQKRKQQETSVLKNYGHRNLSRRRED